MTFGAQSTAAEIIAGIDLSGRVSIVTGGTSGLGIETARTLAGAGAEVILAVRNLVAGAAQAAAINSDIGHDHVSAHPLDLSDLASVREFASKWGDRPLHLLINNAGVMACPQSYTKDGFETQLGTNHLGHFLLSALLTPALKRGAPARVISLSSSAHMAGGLDLEDPHFRLRDYAPFLAYGQSKTANALFAVEYDRRHRDDGIRAFAVMPGVIETNLGRHLTPELMEASGLKPKENAPPDPRGPIHFKTPAQGAATSIWAAVSSDLEGQGGLYLHDCAVAVPFQPGLPRGHGVQSHACDPEAAKLLWIWSEREVGLVG